MYVVYAPAPTAWWLRFACILGKKTVIHWIGTDVMRYTSAPKKQKYPQNISHLVGSKWLGDELLRCGVQSNVVPIIPYSMQFDIVEMPKTHAVLVYLPEGRETFYGSEYICDLAKRNENVLFYIVANSGYAPLKLPNVVFLGTLPREQMKELYKKISILVRFPEHDGLSMMVIEALGKGKQVIWKYEHPFVFTPSRMAPDNINKTFQEIIEIAPTVNIEGHNYVLNKYNQAEVAKLYEDFKVFSKE